MTPAAVLNRQIAALRGNRIVRVLLDATDMMVLLLNGERQILFASEAFCKLVGKSDDAGLVGLRLGNAWHCIHADQAPEGCGGSEACRHCTVYNTIARAVSDNETQTQEASVVYLDNSLERALNVLEHVVPAELFGVDCYIVTLIDISDTLHRKWFERLFFHDILNKLGALGNYLELMSREMPESLIEDMRFVRDAFSHVVADIRYQKQVTEAESGELHVEGMTLVPDELVEQVVRLFERYAVSRRIRLEAQAEPSGCTLFCDYLLLRRVLENMCKNALEASSAGDSVLVGVDGPTPMASFITFWVSNPAHMPAQVQSHVFQRNFSTKGAGRGMGTYSMKLIGERVLGGEVGFTSTRESGTRFYFRLPVQSEAVSGTDGVPTVSGTDSINRPAGRTEGETE